VRKARPVRKDPLGQLARPARPGPLDHKALRDRKGQPVQLVRAILGEVHGHLEQLMRHTIRLAGMEVRMLD
jgi:hypothetical protein